MKFSSSIVVTFVASLFLGQAFAAPTYRLAAHNQDLKTRDFETRDVAPIESHRVYASRDFDDEDMELALRESEEVDLEGRQVDIVFKGVQIAIQAFIHLGGAIKRDKNKRSEFTKNLVAEMNKNDPKMNYVVCGTKHTYKFDGERGKDWTHRHQEFDIKIGGTVGYEIYAFKSGEFTRQGDGGFLNWSYFGNMVKSSKDGKHLTFGPR